MAARNPQRFFNFAAEHYALLEELLRFELITDAELLALAARQRKEYSASAESIAASLIELGFLEPAPEGGAYEMPLPVWRFLQYVREQYHLTSVRQIAGYIEELDDLRQRLEASIEQQQPAQAAVLLTAIADTIEQVRQDMHGNREKITNEVQAARANPERLPLRARYENIARIFTDYLSPMREIIDPTEPFQGQLDQLDQTLGRGAESLLTQPAVVEQCQRTRRRLTRMRQHIAADFHQAMLEVEPLYRAYREESRAARGASLLLEQVRQHGKNALTASPQLNICRQRRGMLFHDLGVLGYAHAIGDADPHEVVRIEEAPGQASATDELLLVERVQRELREAGQVDDVLGWLIERLKGRASTGVLLRCLGDAIGELGAAPAEQRRSHHFGEVRVHGYVRRLQKDGSHD